MAFEPVVFGDAEAAILALLRAALPTVPGTSFGVVLPDGYRAASGPFVRVERIGGVGDGLSHDLARVDIEVWGASREKTHDLLQRALAHLRTARYRGGVYAGQVFYECSVELGPSYVPDNITSEPRWISAVVVRLRPYRSAS